MVTDILRTGNKRFGRGVRKMAFLIRKINRSKWPNSDYENFSIDDLVADAITSDLRTSKNTLSTWEIQNEEEVLDAVLALSSGFERLDTIDVIILDKTEVINVGFELIETPGITPVKDLVDTHKDIVNLTFKSIGLFSKLILDTLGKDKVKRIREKEVKKLLIDAIQSGRLNADSLKDGLRKKLAV
jgi:hypothetical protein